MILPSFARRLIASVILAMTLFSAAPVLADDREDLLALEARWNQAIIDKDVRALDGILAPDFLYITPRGAVIRRADLIAGVQGRRVTVDPFVTEEVEVRLYGDTAVLTGRFTQTLRLGDQHETTTYRYTDVYVRDGAGWRAVTAHSSVIPPAA